MKEQKSFKSRCKRVSHYEPSGDCYLFNELEVRKGLVYVRSVSFLNDFKEEVIIPIDEFKFLISNL